MTLQQTAKPFAVSVAVAAERKAIYRFRHDVYARELEQHGTNSSGCLRDSLDDRNVYLVAKVQGEMAGFISITPPARATYSIDKYFSRDKLPFPFDDRLYEVRLLTVLKPQRGGESAALLMYAALRWVEVGQRLSFVRRRVTFGSPIPTAAFCDAHVCF
jgi:hypothetical protein